MVGIETNEPTVVFWHGLFRTLTVTIPSVCAVFISQIIWG